MGAAKALGIAVTAAGYRSPSFSDLPEDHRTKGHGKLEWRFQELVFEKNQKSQKTNQG